MKNKKFYNSKKSSISFLKIVTIYYKKYLWRFLLIIIFTALSSISLVAAPKIIKEIITPKVLQGPLKSLFTYLGIVISLFFISGIFNFLQNFLGGIIAKKIEIDIRHKILKNIMLLDLGFYVDKKTGEILTKIISDTNIIAEQAQQIPISFLSSIFTFIFGVAVLFTISVKLTIVAIVASLTIFIILLFLFTIFKKITYKVKKVITSINGDITDRIGAIHLIKSSATEEYEQERFLELHKLYYEVSFKQVRLSSAVMAFLIMSISSLSMIVLIAGIIFMHNNQLVENDPHNIESIGLIISFVLGINVLIMPIMSLVRVINYLANASASAIRISELLSTKSKINRNLDQSPLRDIRGNIIFENVTFHYPESKDLILKNFSYVFKEGKSYAFVGETGVGKSTISKLLLRFYDPIKGHIFINDDKDLSKINLPSFLKNVGYVEQEPQIFYGNVFENVSYGVLNVTKEEAIIACKKANLHRFIMSLPQKYSTILGERGLMLSGGQKQRLVIARMFLKNPKILILDEATSALDNIVEKEIQLNLQKLMKGRTTFVIAHRLSTIKNVDEILVLEKDKGIVQKGTFENLKNINGQFKKLYDAGLMV